MGCVIALPTKSDLLINQKNQKCEAFEVFEICEEHDETKKEPNILINLINDTNKTDFITMTNDEIFDMINWIDKYKPTEMSYQLIKNNLILEYKERIKSQINNYFLNIDKTIYKDLDGSIHTDKSKNIFFVIKTISNVIKDKLSLEYAKDICLTIMQLLRDDQRSIYNDIENNKLFNENLISIVNDCFLLENTAHNISHSYSGISINNLIDELFDEILKELHNEYENIILKCVDYVSINLIQELEFVYFSKIFTKSWETDLHEALTKSFIVMLKFYLSETLELIKNDLHKSYFLEKISTHLIYTYISCLNKKTKPFKNSSVVDKMKYDKDNFRLVFLEYFNNYKNFDIDKFDAIDKIIKIFSSKKFDLVKKERDELCILFGTNGVDFAKTAFYLNPINSKKKIDFFYS